MYVPSMRCRVAILPLALLLVPIFAGDAAAQRRARPACGLDYLPFVEGTVWTYRYVPPAEPPKQNSLRQDPPKEVRIEVKSVESERRSADITLVESYREVERETHVRCDREGIYVDPQSFFFAAEPGGGLRTELDDLERQVGPTWPGGPGGLRRGKTWREEITVEVERTPSEGSEASHEPGRVEVEREAAVQGIELATSGMADHPKAIKVKVNFAGRAYVRVREKPVAIPSGNSVMWFDPGVGLVRAENRLKQGWELTGHELPESD